jgi:nitrate/nitrite-specific signal transduction histidine kinase
MFSIGVTTRLGQQPRLLLANNYRSILAAERMKRSLDRINSGALQLLAGTTTDVPESIAAHRRMFEDELVAEEGNITEWGEATVTRHLRSAWDDYSAALGNYLALSHGADRHQGFSHLEPAFSRVDQLEDEILSINEYAMERKVDQAEERARQFRRLVAATVIVALALGVLASFWLTTRLLRPLATITAVVRRLSGNDFTARVEVTGQGEINVLAQELNSLAEGLDREHEGSPRDRR